jgi:hypothetical protein
MNARVERCQLAPLVEIGECLLVGNARDDALEDRRLASMKRAVAR